MEVAALVVLVAIIIVLLWDRHDTARQHARERERLLNAVIAQSPRDLAVLNREPLPRPASEPSTHPPNPEGA